MNKNTIKILIGAGVVIMIAAGIFVFYALRSPAGSNPAADNGQGAFPATGDNAGIGGPSSSAGNAGANTGINSLSDLGKAGALVQLTQNAVSGAAAMGTSSVYYVEKSSGNIYKIDLSKQARERVSNTTILKSFEAQWSPKGHKLAIRYFDDPQGRSGTKLSIKTILASFASPASSKTIQTSASTSLQTVVVPQALSALAVSPSEDKIFYIAQLDGAPKGLVADFKNKNQKIVLDIPFGDFNASWPAKDKIALTTKPSYAAEGYFYFLDPKTGSLNRVLGNIKGLTATVSPLGDKILYSASGKNGAQTFIFDLSKNTATPFGLPTLPEKCVWSKKDKNMIYCGVPDDLSGDNLPDSWYQGLGSFNDSLWKKNLLTGETALLSEKFGADIISPVLSSDDGYLFFTNKKDGTLWGLKLK